MLREAKRTLKNVDFEEMRQTGTVKKKKKAEARVGSIRKIEVWTVFGTRPAL